MNLHENKELFQDAIKTSSQLLVIPEIYIEKDYWVTKVLHEIFHSEMADQAVFKGGTALSKCHNLIERFSEDIDIVVIKGKGETDNKLKKKTRAISKIVTAILPEIEIPGLTNKKGKIRKTAHQYDKYNTGKFGQVREQIILEVTSMGDAEPYTRETISCYLTEMMLNKKQDGIIKDYNMQAFELNALSKEKALCEKIMSLVRFSHQSDPYADLANKIRHIYDIHLMLKNDEILHFFNSNDFDKMILKVGQDDMVNFANNNEWLKKHPAEAIIFSKPRETWSKIKKPYRTTFKELVIGELPDESDLIDTLTKVSNRIENIEWKL